MPLELFAILVPVGITIIVLVVKYSGLSKKAILNSGEMAQNVFAKDFGGETLSGNVIVTKNGSAAFVELNSSGNNGADRATGNCLGLVEAVGDRFITRLLRFHDLGTFNKQDEASLSVKYNDFTHPMAIYGFDGVEDLSTVWDWLNKLEHKK